MRRVSTFLVLKRIKYLLFALIMISVSCSLEKKSGINSILQNLTAHYNILFNAKEILSLKQESYATTFIDNYNEILSVYQDTIAQSNTPDKDLDAAITKANIIINVKEQSNYLGDAYLVLGKAAFLEGNYFNAIEFLSYVIRNYPKRQDLLQDALTWKARSLIYLNQLPEAKLVLDTALQNINPKKKTYTAGIYATKLQYDINVQDYVDGELMAKQAISFCSEKVQRLRWTFISGQLLELNKKPGDAFKNYAEISKSNAVFEMAFNARLNQLRIEESLNGIKISRVERLRGLLKDPNNNEFKDQIYFQVAELYMVDKDIENAVKNYKLSIRYSLKNQNQKGLSYLRLAEINFKIKADYLTAKKYYDSTLITLPNNYPGYLAIQKKSNNLQLLADRLQIITREDTLQALSKVDEKTRLAIIDKMVNDNVIQQQAIANNYSGVSATANDDGGLQAGGSTGSGSFYFYNSNALSQGFTDFKRKWGNRKLEDNWRRSNRANSDIANNASNSFLDTDPISSANQLPNGKTAVTAGDYRHELMQGLPLTPAQISNSNLRIYNAYIDIGNFYRDILVDKNEAIAYYELIIRRFPDDPNKPAVYYNLYRLYSEIDKAKSDSYKNRLLKDYAETPFAKIIADPDFAKKLDDENAGFTQLYNPVFDLYANKKYKEVITAVPMVLKQYPGNKLSAQLYYLQVIAAGHFEKLSPFRDSLKKILTKYPNDKLIAPLITQHLTYINANEAEMLLRPVVLSDNDPEEIPFTLAPDLKKEATYRKALSKDDIPAINAALVISSRVQSAKVEPPTKLASSTPFFATVKPEANKPQPLATNPSTIAINISQRDSTAIKQPDAVTYIYSQRDSTNYYFVVNVSSGTTNLSSSRFGIGQFNRANYAGKGIKHQLLAVDADNQLIFVGRFFTLNAVKKYAGEIIPLLPEIMKVPGDKYSFFIITHENLDKLTNKKLLDSYADYYQKTY